MASLSVTGAVLPVRLRRRESSFGTETVQAPIRWRFAGASLLGNAALAFGPWLVRLADTGPVAAGFWRLALRFPFLWRDRAACRAASALAGPRDLHHAGRRHRLFFAADLAAWHVGIRMTKLGNATLFGNVASLSSPAGACGWRAVGRRTMQALALVLAAGGAGLLMARQLRIVGAQFHRRPAHPVRGPALHRLPDRGASGARTRCSRCRCC